MEKLNYELHNLCKRIREGSYKTQKDRRNMLQLCARELKQLGYRQMNASSLKEKHVKALVTYWLDKGLSAGTIKNRKAALSWWAEKVGKYHLVDTAIQQLDIPDRVYNTESKACNVTQAQLDQIIDPYVRASVTLIKAFGLRKEEAIKIIPQWADQGDFIQLKGSWCKGGRPRQVPILTPAQREALDQAKQIAGSGALIPPTRTSHQQMKRYEYTTYKAGLKNLHGLRHLYAQERYKTLTGWECSFRGGRIRKELIPEEKVIDKEARLTISEEMGHGGIDVARQYIGK